MRASHHLLIASLGLLLVACSGMTEQGGPGVDTTLTLWNRAQSPLLEVRVHGPEGYAGAANLLAEPLAVETEVEVPFHTGQQVTVFRRRVELADPSAFTTAEGLWDVDGAGYVLIVFDASFRLMDPGWLGQPGAPASADAGW